jgi:hypothetical protein
MKSNKRRTKSRSFTYLERRSLHVTQTNRNGGVLGAGPNAWLWGRRLAINRSFSVTAEATIPEKGAEGVLMAQGGRFGGYSLFVKDNKLHFAYNFCGIDEKKVASDIDVPTGKVTLKVDFKKIPKDVKLPPMEQLGAGGIATLSINGKAAGTLKLDKTIPIQFTLAGDGLCVGYDGGTPVSAAYTGHYPFTGTVERIIVNVGDDGPAFMVPKKDKTRD